MPAVDVMIPSARFTSDPYNPSRPSTRPASDTHAIRTAMTIEAANAATGPAPKDVPAKFSPFQRSASRAASGLVR